MRAILPLLLVFAAAEVHAAPEPMAVAMDPPRPFGYVIGDLVPLANEFTLPKGCEPVPAALPQPGRIDYWLELRSAALRPLGAGRYRFERVYQTFFAPLEVKTLTIPPLELGYRCGRTSAVLPLPAWHFTTAPIRPLAVGKGEDDGYLRPDRPPHPGSLRAAAWRLSAWALGGLLMTAGLAWLDGWLPGFGRHRPFARAWHALRLLAREPLVGPRLLAAYAVMHEAFNATQGKPVFAEHLDDFFAARPGWVILKAEIQVFFAASYAVHFGAEEGLSPAGYPPQRLLDLASACRRRERSSR